MCAAAIACAPDASTASGDPTAADAKSFLDTVNATLLKLGVAQGQAGWVQQTYITDDTEAISARANQELIDAIARFAKDATKFDKVEVPADQRRQLKLLKVSLVHGDAFRSERVRRAVERFWRGLRVNVRQGQVVPRPGEAGRAARTSTTSRACSPSRATRKRSALRGKAGTRSRRRCARTTRASSSCRTKARKELGFADTGAMWRAKYDMPPDEFTKELDRLWEQVRPLYLKLHAYVRMKLRAKYGDVVPATGPIPAHLLGNIWAQDWTNIYPLVAPANADPGFSLTDILKKRNMPALDMVRTGERFYTSLGFAPLPKTFWERSLFVRPKDRDVVCHASAWDVDLDEDIRIKMCIEQTAEDFTTIHHELGHNFYQRAYKDLPPLFRDSANDGFHEAIGDTIALSVTPEYLVKIGLLDKAPDASRDIGLLMNRALEKIAFLPFGLLIDQWRWKVFSGEITRGRLQQGVVGFAAEVPGRRAAVGARRRVLRSRREVSRPGQHAVHAVFPGGHPAVPVPSRAVEGGRLHAAAAPVLDLREQGGWTAAQRHAVDGTVAAVAGGARSADRFEADGRDRDSRLLRAAERRGSTIS